MIKYLKPKQHYIDLYDRFTVERCRTWEKICFDDKKPIVYEGKELGKEDALKFNSFLFDLTLWFKKGEEHERKEKTIRGWMERDEARDSLVESAQAPENIRCLTCYMLMDVESKDLCTWLDDKNERVMFMYKCSSGHYPMRSFFSDGEEYKTKPRVCPKCQTVLDIDHKKKAEHKVTTIETCPSCGYTKTEEMDFTVKKEKIDKNFEKDRARFCATEKDAREYAEFKATTASLQQLLDKHKEREENKEVYEQVEKLQKLTVVDLENLLIPILEKASYIKLQFGQPDMGKDLFLPFTVHDTKSERRDRASTYSLEKLLRKALDDTNWRLMSDGTSYRVGILSGRLRAYEREEDQLELIRLKKKKLSKVSKV
ncbi:MAG: hypothetical protein NTW35_00195 [Candidatus Nomurabacteria bacterium]|nr:hypothetical protein [Candidatus Nomurabacteria bacterium]